MEARRFGFGDIWNEAGALFQAHLGFLLGVTAAVAAGYALLDLTVSDTASSIPSLVVSIFVQYLVLERLLADRMLPGTVGNRRYGAMFVCGLLGGLGIVVGLILLIAPGVFLAAAWMAASAFVVAENRSGTEALGASWQATAGSRAPIVLVILITYVPLMAVFFGGLLTLGFSGVIDETALDGPVAIIVTDIVVSVLGTWGWVLGAAVYNLAVPPGAAVDEVFG